MYLPQLTRLVEEILLVGDSRTQDNPVVDYISHHLFVDMSQSLMPFSQTCCRHTCCNVFADLEHLEKHSVYVVVLFVSDSLNFTASCESDFPLSECNLIAFVCADSDREKVFLQLGYVEYVLNPYG